MPTSSTSRQPAKVGSSAAVPASKDAVFSAAFFCACAIVLTLMASVMPARAAIFGDDEARKAILELRDSLTEMSRQTHESLDAMAKRIDVLENRIGAVQSGQLASADKNDAATQEIAKLRGAAEQLANEIALTQKREHDLYADLDQRVRKLEPTAVTVDGHSAQVERDEQLAYDTAVAQFRANDYRSAINALGTFVARYPQSVYTAAAQFWLGSSYYAVKDFASAIIVQQAMIEHFPDSPRIPEALLNIAASQAELNDRSSARATLTRISNDFPDSEAAKLAKERLATLPPPAKDKKK